MKCPKCGDTVQWYIDQYEHFCVRCDGDCTWEICDQYSEEQPEVLRQWWEDVYERFQQALNNASGPPTGWKCKWGEWKLED